MAETEKVSHMTPKNLLALNPSKEAEFKKKVQEFKKRPRKAALQRGVVYVSHLPNGLFEPQLQQYFQQFGAVTRLRLSRSKKTGGSKGYAFIEFECDEVAKIVAETMNNYLMDQRLIKCRVIPPEKIHPRLFVGSQRVFRKPRHPEVDRYNRNRTAEQLDCMTSRLVSKELKLRKRLAAKGIDYDFPGFASQTQKKRMTSDANASTCSQDDTPVCTPSVLEKRKSLRREDYDNDNDEDEEIIIKGIQTPMSKGSQKVVAEESSERKSCDDGSKLAGKKRSVSVKKGKKKKAL